MITVRRLTMLALYTALALIIHIVEALIPLPVPLPGVKLGLANVVTLFMLFSGRHLTVIGGAGTGNTNKHNLADVFIVLLGRIIPGALISGRPVTVIYALAGGLLAILVQIALRPLITDRQIWACGAAGAVFHNIGQLAAASVITGTASIIYYLPVLIISGIITGVITGIIAQLTIIRLKKITQPDS